MTKGNLIDLAEQGRFDVIVHGCNCFHTMRSGIAKEIVSRYPQALEADKMYTDCGDNSKLGGFTWALVIAPNGVSFTIVNAYTQFRYGRDKMHADYSAIKNVFQAIAKNYPHYRIGYPKIGAGLAGGDWTIIEKIINKALIGINHSLVIL